MITKILEVFDLEEIKKIAETIISKNYAMSQTGPDNTGFNGTSFENSITDFNKVLNPLGFNLMLIKQATWEEEFGKKFIINLPHSNSSTLKSLFKEFKNTNSNYSNSDVILCSVSDTHYDVIDAASLKTCQAKWLILTNDAGGDCYNYAKEDNNEEEISDALTFEVSQTSNETNKLNTALGEIIVCNIDDDNKKSVFVEILKFNSDVKQIIENLKNEEGYEFIDNGKKIQIKIKNPLTSRKHIVVEIHNRNTTNDSSKPTSWTRGFNIHKQIINKVCMSIHKFNFDGEKEIRERLFLRANGIS